MTSANSDADFNQLQPAPLPVIEINSDWNDDWIRNLPTTESERQIAAGLLQTSHLKERIIEGTSFIIYKHMAGRHNQKRHGWRYGGGAGGAREARLAAARASMHRNPEAAERAEYRRRAGMPEPTKISHAPEPPKPPAPAPVVALAPSIAPAPPRKPRTPKPKPPKPTPPPKPDSDYVEMPADDSYASHASFHDDPGWRKWLDNLTPSERQAIQEWVGRPGHHGTYKELNKALRNGTFDAAGHPHSTVTKTYKGMNSIIEKGSLHKDMVLWRSINLSSLHNGAGTTFKKGDVLPDRAFVATSPKRGTATGWFFMSGSYPVLWRIKAPKGSHGAYVSWDELSNPYMHESEFVLPRNSRFRIDDVSFKTVDGRRTAYYDMTLLGEGE